METATVKSSESDQQQGGSGKSLNVFSELENAIYESLKTYSNVHRGSGHFSMLTTHLYEKCREIVLDYDGSDKKRSTVIFCTPRRAELLTSKISSGNYRLYSCTDIGLSLGVRAIVAKKKDLSETVMLESGGGTANLTSKEWVLRANVPDRFEAGTPAIINVIAFTKALLLTQKYGKEIFGSVKAEKNTAKEILYEDELSELNGVELLRELRQKLIGRNIVVPSTKGMIPFTNLDSSASTRTFEPIWESFMKSWHQSHDQQKEIISEVKTVISNVLQAPLSDYDIIFTSNTTEAINLARESFEIENSRDPDQIVLSTLLEHSSNDLPWRMKKTEPLIRISLDENGLFDLEEMEKILKEYNQEGKFGKKRIQIVTVSGASNVLGICNDLEQVSKLVHKYGAKLLVDGAQLVAHRRVNILDDKIDFLAFSAHKVYAPFGCGVLVAQKESLIFSPDEMEGIRMSGEENAGGIAALGKSLVLLDRIGMNVIAEEEKKHTFHLLNQLNTIKGLTTYGIKQSDSDESDKKIGVVVFSLKKMMSDQLAKKLAYHGGLGTRFGCHCAHVIVKHILNVGPTLEKFQRLMLSIFPKAQLPGVLRVSFGLENTEKDVDVFMQTLRQLVEKKGNITDKQNGKEITTSQVKKEINEFIADIEEKVFKTS